MFQTSGENLVTVKVDGGGGPWLVSCRGSQMTRTSVPLLRSTVKTFDRPVLPTGRKPHDSRKHTY